MNTDRRKSIAHVAMSILRRIDGVDSACLHGSLSGPTADRYSDIDIKVEFPADDARSASRKVQDAMQTSLGVEFMDWAPSLLPDTPVMTYSIVGLSIFWNIDVEISVPARTRNVTADMVRNNPIGHLLKLWSVTLKHRIRNDQRSAGEIEKVWGRTVGTGAVPADGYLALRGALDVMAASMQFPSFIAQCHEELKEVEGT